MTPDYIVPGLFAISGACCVVCVARGEQKFAATWWFAAMGWALCWKLDGWLR